MKSEYLKMVKNFQNMQNTGNTNNLLYDPKLIQEYKQMCDTLKNEKAILDTKVFKQTEELTKLKGIFFFVLQRFLFYFIFIFIYFFFASMCSFVCLCVLFLWFVWYFDDIFRTNQIN